MKRSKYPWFAPKMQVFESGEVQDMCGEDVSFCLDAKEIWCDPRDVFEIWCRSKSTTVKNTVT